MQTDFQALEADDQMLRAVQLTLDGSQKDFPVLAAGELVGVLRQEDVLRGLHEVGPGARVREDDLIFSHASHMGSYEAKCEDCHGQPAATAFVRKAPLEMKATCIDCHQK